MRKYFCLVAQLFILVALVMAFTGCMNLVNRYYDKSVPKDQSARVFIGSTVKLVAIDGNTVTYGHGVYVYIPAGDRELAFSVDQTRLTPGDEFNSDTRYMGTYKKIFTLKPGQKYDAFFEWRRGDPYVELKETTW